MAGHKCKFQFLTLLVFVVQYTPTVIHAIDGLGAGLILVPVNGNFILKIYGDSECYSDLVLPMLELQGLMI